ncbi:hypothetical protein G3O08_10885 [Cryomorpha ignava]|uniref:Addiction module protein n=1 Tax=Cryomorpha ignava TaxID=101383 RepID=A0A7K3WRA5_9FLAO|nr:hypothetical protein [Cryomorpha ignava]NEN24004.1 hypothetical protein [Cryomorpha ignava]
MDIQSRKIVFIQEFLKVNDEEVISLLEKILGSINKHPSEDDFTPMSVQEFHDRIDKSMKDSSEGRLIKASDLKERIKKWT